MSDDEQLAKIKKLLQLKDEYKVIDEQHTILWRQLGDLRDEIKRLEIEIGVREVSYT